MRQTRRRGQRLLLSCPLIAFLFLAHVKDSALRMFIKKKKKPTSDASSHHPTVKRSVHENQQMQPVRGAIAHDPSAQVHSFTCSARAPKMFLPTHVLQPTHTNTRTHAHIHNNMSTPKHSSSIPASPTLRTATPPFLPNKQSVSHSLSHKHIIKQHWISFQGKITTRKPSPTSSIPGII